MPEDIVFLVAVSLIGNGFVVVGVWVLLQYDVYGREQDMEQLATDDASFDGTRLALLLGVAARGESAKTGIYQGVIVRMGLVIDLVLGLVDHLGPGVRMLQVSQG